MFELVFYQIYDKLCLYINSKRKKIRQLATMVENTDEALLKLVGSRIKSLRKDRKLSLRDLAYKIGMEPSNLSVIENGKSNPQLLTFARISATFGIQLRDLFDIEFDFQLFIEKPTAYTPRKHS
jgi:DNA-binding XRE family transcriptional regulator